MNQPDNHILTDDARISQNFYKSDNILQAYLKHHLSPEAMSYMNEKLDWLGHQSAAYMDWLSQEADRHPPKLKRRSRWGEDIDEIQFHPAYWQLMEIAARSEMFYVKYHPELRKQFQGNRQKMSFAAGQLYGMSEIGQYCPHCMTDGAAHLLDRFAEKNVADRLIPRLSSRHGQSLYTGAMFLTEKAGGSDVGSILTQATHTGGSSYRLDGEKWFCSNVNADVIMTLARTEKMHEGIRGLSLFLVEKYLPNGDRNPMEILRLKDKLGVRSMATGEVRFKNTLGIRLGQEGEGFKLMADMINLSRSYNSMAALSGCRRAIIEAYQYLNYRVTFGKRAIKHALIRQKFHELGSLYLANFLLVWRTIRAMDKADTGDEHARQLLRILIPVIKWTAAETGVYIVRECMELMGGNGYIEDFVMPKLLRDVNVLPIWEGAGNIIVLDMIRASEKSEGMDYMIRTIREMASRTDDYGKTMEIKLDELLQLWEQLQDADRDVLEATAKPLFKTLIHLYQMALMIEEQTEDNHTWTEPALVYMASGLNPEPQIMNPLSVSGVDGLIGWEY